MDNLSHSVVGLAVGELIHRSLAQEPDSNRQSVRRRLLLLCGWAASNFPDLDLFLTPLLPAPLGYLLHHRGHTHTLLYAIPQALLLLGAACLWPSVRQLLKESALARTGTLAAVCFGLVLHMMMDYLNSYGIHPFHPIDSRWLFGDMVFIVEPFFWIIFGTPLVMMVQNRFVRVLLSVPLAGAPVFFAMKGYLPWGSLAVLLSLGFATAWMQIRAGPHRRHVIVAAFCASLVFVLIQGTASETGKVLVTSTVQAKHVGSIVLDVAMTSYPTNPLCWNFVSVESNEHDGSFTLRRGIASLSPSIMPAHACPAPLSAERVDPNGDPTIAFLSEDSGSLAQLRRLRNENCHVDAWLRFARAPLLGDEELSDARFGWRQGNNFTTIRIDAGRNQKCSGFVPGWEYPRSDLLDGERSGEEH